MGSISRRAERRRPPVDSASRIVNRPLTGLGSPVVLNDLRGVYNTMMPANTTKYRLDPGQIEVVEEAVAAILRQKTIAERIALTAAAHRTARALLTAQVRSQHADWSDDAVAREVARRLTRGTD